MGLARVPWRRIASATLALVMLWIEEVQATPLSWSNLFGPIPSGPAIPETLSVQEGISLIEKEGLDSLSLDIGGSLVKALVLQKGARTHNQSHVPWTSEYVSGRRGRPPRLTLHVPELGGTLTFLTCETREIADCYHLAKLYSEKRGQNASDPSRPPVVVRVTGGGGYQFARGFAEAGVTLDRRDEMACLVNGVSFLLRFVDKEAFTVDSSLGPARVKPSDGMQTYRQNFLTVDSAGRFPYLLVNIGSGVSIVEVRTRRDFRRVSGSSLGGAAFFSLCQLLTEYKSYQEILDGSQMGDLTKVDMLVGDLYPGPDAPFGLASDVIANSLGKVPHCHDRRGPWRLFVTNFVRAVWGTLWLWVNFLLSVPVMGRLLKRLGLERWTNATYLLSPWAKFGPQDVTLSLLRAIINTIGQIACLNAKSCDIKRIVFTGNFLRNDPYIQATVTHAVQFWSQGSMEAIFLTHQGFAGCLGAHLCSTPYRLGWKGSVYAGPKARNEKQAWPRVANIGKLARLWLKGLEKDVQRGKYK